MVMLTRFELMLSVLKLVTVILGGYIVLLGLRAYKKAPSRSILLMTVAIATLSMGAISEGVAGKGWGWDLAPSHLFEAIVTLVGFVFLVMSVRVRQ